MNLFKTSLLLILVGSLCSLCIQASEINLELSNGQLSARVKGIKFPVTEVLQEMKSGLPNQVNFVVSLDSVNSNLHRRSISYVVTYDLWDENYQVYSSEDQQEKLKKIKGDNQLVEFLANYELPNLLVLTEKSVSGPLTLSYRLILNPIDVERIAKIKNWIQTSQGFEPLEQDETNGRTSSVPQLDIGRGGGLSVGGNNIGQANPSLVSSGPRFQKLFDKILEQNMSDDSIAAQWKSQLFVETFTLNSVKNEKP